MDPEKAAEKIEVPEADDDDWGDPFASFSEWSSAEDDAAFADP